MFIPGETVTHEFTIPFADAELSKVVVTYKQDERIVLTKTISSFEKVTETKTKITLPFSQQDSLMFKDDTVYTIQLNVYTTRGSRAACTEFKSNTGKQHYKKVISNGT